MIAKEPSHLTLGEGLKTVTAIAPRILRQGGKTAWTETIALA